MGSSGSKPSGAAARASELNEKQIEGVTASVSSLHVRSSAIPKVEPLSADGSIGTENFKEWDTAIAEDPRLAVSKAVLNHADLKTTLLQRNTLIRDPHVYNTKLPFNPNKKVTNQKSSGRCWLFATTNVIRYNMANTLGLEDFQLSQSYLSFYDKLNKANYYLENSIENVDLPIDDRLIVHLATDPVADGGQWDMALNLLKNYGVVPQSIFPESYSSSATSRLNSIVTTKLREHALLLRASVASLRASGAFAHLTAEQANDELVKVLRKEKEVYVGEIYKILTIAQGEPPKPNEKFLWEYYDKKGDYKSWEGTPIEFLKAFGSKQYPILDAFSIINDPRHEYGKLYTVEKLGNVWGGLPIRYVNTTSDDLKAAIVKSIKAGQPVFFGCDVGKSSDSPSGVMDVGLYGLESAFGVEFGMDKAQRLRTNESAMTHAMVITAVHVDPATGKPVRFRVENSWNNTVGDDGYMVMTDKWFDEYAYQVVISRQLADPAHVKILDGGDFVALKPWDPLGALA
ncbi:peptidase C1B, bleomycin hydrolase [Clavulina sp. PMI_390]|nr:peptidase C1B, bleomycin hydrolase [Clavulina sp. PMI_390]